MLLDGICLSFVTNLSHLKNTKNKIINVNKAERKVFLLIGEIIEFLGVLIFLIIMVWPWQIYKKEYYQRTWNIMQD